MERLGAQQGYWCTAALHKDGSEGIHVGALLTLLWCAIRPLVLGQRVSNARIEYCIASEDCAFGPVGFERVRDVAPGEMLVSALTASQTGRNCLKE